ncbi:hypothetical protein [Rhodopseudomonas sp. B29]|uniref:hypothetical protein n=1 Tax=Rhodopseudomonas sp. B29 TaxID=95607 RepID=UPI0003486902|nr:hypothetical protein [Rhodopseudomonas sp. B29]
MKTSDVTCPQCGAGFQRLELQSLPGTSGEYRCPVCDDLLERFDGHNRVAYRLTIESAGPERYASA